MAGGATGRTVAKTLGDLRWLGNARAWRMNSDPKSMEVRHNPSEKRFEAQVGDQLSVADYELRGTDIVMTHTFVPATLRGQGIAEKLVRAALEHARNERLRVVPACSYVEAYIKRHPEFHPLVVG